MNAKAKAKAGGAKAGLRALPHSEDAGLVHALAVSGDRQWLASGDHYNRIHVFNLDTMQVLLAFCCALCCRAAFI